MFEENTISKINLFTNYEQNRFKDVDPTQLTNTCTFGLSGHFRRVSSLQPVDFQSAKKKRENILQDKKSYFSNQNKLKNERKQPQRSINTQNSIRKETILSKDGRVLGKYFLNKREHCIKCGELVHKKSMKIHSKYYCNARHDEEEWKLCGSLAFCKKCNKTQEPDSIEFHVGYLCQKRQILVQCFYCPRIFDDYRGLLKHTSYAHHKKHKYQDLISILPPAECLFSVQGPVKIVKNFFSNYLNTTEEANSEINSSSNVSLQVRKKSTHECRSCGKVIVGTHAFEDHVNTQCESEKQYFCFFCPFKDEYPYQVLDHMEVDHNKKFNTFDVIQAKLTGIIPILETNSTESVSEDNEVEFANHQLFEPYIREAQMFKKKINTIKFEQHTLLNRKKMSAKDGNENTQNCQDNDQNNTKTETKQSVTKSNEDKSVDIFTKTGIHKIEFMKNISLRVSKKKIKIGNNIICGNGGKRKNITKIQCSKCQEQVIPGDMSIHKKYHCGKRITNDWILQSGKALCLRCKKLQPSSTIDFHVNYICKKKVFSIQCFYCQKIGTSYRSLLVHMNKGHNKVHYYQDFMTILPKAESVLRTPQKALTSIDEQKVVRHPFIYKPPKDEQNSDPTCLKFPSLKDFYNCLYCTFKSKAAFKVLNHMEEMHTGSHNIYDLLRAKMLQT